MIVKIQHRRLLYMINNTKAFGLLLAGTVLSSPTMAVEIPQALTLDRLNTEVFAFLNNSANVDVSSLHDLSADKSGEIDVSVNIDGKIYYLTPKDAANATLLQTLANIGSEALIKLDSADGALYRLESGGETFYYGYNAEALPKSGYTLAEISAEEAASSDSPVIKKYTKNSDNSLTEKYYRVKIDPSKFDNFATHETIKWKEIPEGEKNTEIANSGVISFAVPGEGVKYYRYSYDPNSYNNDDNSRKLYTERFPNGTFPLNTPVDADFIGNELLSEKSSAYGGVIYNLGKSVIGDISGDFVSNHVQGSSYAKGGAVYNNASTIGNINGNFVNNYAKSLKSSAYGGAIHSDSTSTMGNISGDFIHNYAEGKSAYGGVIYNYSRAVMGDLTGDFINNYAEATSSNAYGGAVYNYNSSIGNMTGSFINNFAQTADSTASGGVIYNEGATIGNIAGDFIGNYAEGKYAYGGAVYNKKSVIGNISGDFIDNSVRNASYNAEGGAIYNPVDSTIGDVAGDFINNSAQASSSYGASSGGAVYNYGTLGNITGDFVNNYVKGVKSAQGGAVYNRGTIGDITGSFINNSAQITSSGAYGGAVMNSGTTGEISGDFINNAAQTSSASSASGGAVYNGGTIKNIVNSSFIGNFASSNEKAQGGAVYSSKNLNMTAADGVVFFSGNYSKDKRGKIYNALYATDTSTIAFDSTGDGTWVINDNLQGGNYVFHGDDVIDADTGTTTQYVAINNDIVNAGTVTVENTTLRFGAYQHEDQTAKNWDGKGAFVAALNEDGSANRDADAVTSLTLNNGVFDIANGYQDVVKLKGYSATDSFMHIDVDTDNMSADMLNVAGNVEGVTKMIVHASSNADIRDKGEILFAQSENDTTGNAGSFVVSRVYKSPYLFDVNYTQRAENSNQWGLVMNDESNGKTEEPEEPDVPTPPTPELPDIPNIPVKPTPSVDYRKVAPEVIAYQGLPVAALEQTKGMVGNIGRQVQGRRFYCPGCGFYDSYWNGEAFHNLWANAVYQTSENEALVNVDADVWGLEAGGDLQHDLNNKLGLFLSYRKGNYDMNGDGKHHYSTVGSEIDIDSYLAGLYYRYDRNHWWTFATVYGGIQRVDLKTKDGIKSDTDGTEFGGSIELGYDYALNKTVYLTPSVGAFYTQVDYDDATDSAGKVAKYNTLRQLELEAGVKLTKAFVMDEGYANLYVKPSVVQTVTDGDEVRITGLGKVNTLDDQTLGRIELGGRYGFTEQLSAYGWANHTFGDDYKASTFGLGLSYSW